MNRESEVAVNQLLSHTMSHSITVLLLYLLWSYTHWSQDCSRTEAVGSVPFPRVKLLTR